MSTSRGARQIWRCAPPTSRPNTYTAREVGELRYAVFAHRRFFKGSKVPALEDLP